MRTRLTFHPPLPAARLRLPSSNLSRAAHSGAPANTVSVPEGSRSLPENPSRRPGCSVSRSRFSSDICSLARAARSLSVDSSGRGRFERGGLRAKCMS